MYVKIYFNEKPLFLTDEITEELSEYVRHDDTMVVDELSAPAINTILHEMKSAKIHAGIMVHDDLEELKTRLFRKFTMVPAAGGLVLNEDRQVLMIHRRGFWDLPKGKLDPDETIEECARREVMEETGLQSVKVVEPLIITYHTYEESGHHILKDSHWYLMEGSAYGKLTPQAEEQITDIRWVSREEIAPYVENTFPSIKDVLKKAGYID